MNEIMQRVNSQENIVGNIKVIILSMILLLLLFPAMLVAEVYAQ